MPRARLVLLLCFRFVAGMRIIIYVYSGVGFEHMVSARGAKLAACSEKMAELPGHEEPGIVLDHGVILHYLQSHGNLVMTTRNFDVIWLGSLDVSSLGFL